jgi:hypothetical protein
MRIAFLLLPVVLAGGDIQVRVWARPGTPFIVELKSADGGTAWRRQSKDLEVTPKGWGYAPASGWPDAGVPLTARFALVRDGGAAIVCEEPIGQSKQPIQVIAYERADGGCAVIGGRTAEEALKRYGVQSDGRRPLGDFPPYVPPHVHGPSPEAPRK